MSTVAEQLRNARLGMDLSIEQVAEITKMRTDQIRALEQGDFDFFSAPVYLRGSIRTYATLLKLEVRPLIEDLDRELGQANQEAEAGPGIESGSSLVNRLTLLLSNFDWRKGLAGAVVALALVLSILGYVAWRSVRTPDPLKNLEPGIYKPKVENGLELPVPGTQPRRP